MDIPKNGSSRTSFAFPLGLVLVIAAATPAGVSPVSAEAPAETLTATYGWPGAIAPVEAEAVIASLKKALTACEDNYLGFRIRYRIGVIYFKAGMTEVAKVSFGQISHDPKCPELIRVCSLNMIGQISRLGSENKEALEAFGKVANLLRNRRNAGSRLSFSPAMAALLCSSLISRAEIFELQQNYAAGIAEYSRLLDVVSHSENKEVQSRYAPMANDRMSQLCLRQGETDLYIQLAKALAGRYPEYHRTPIVRLEVECVKFLKDVSANSEFPIGSFSAPARMIACVKNSNGTVAVQNILDKLSALCSEYGNTEGGILLQYHYAWLLDTLGERHKAADMFARISARDAANARDKTQERAIVQSVREYAIIQCAIMAGEKADYKEALRVLSRLQAHPDNSHISELAESVTKGIETLRREVPRNENEQR